MGTLIDRLDGKAVIVWLDTADYSAALLGKGDVPWLDVAEFLAFQRKAQSLLKPDVIALPLAPVCMAWLAAYPALAAMMGSKSRVAFALKTLLADEALRAHLVELAGGLRASVTGAIVALALPSPRAWLELAYAQAHAGAQVDLTDDEVDGAAVYVADFLRGFASCGIDALLLIEAPGFTPANAEAVALYQAVLNVARNYRWDVGVKVEGALAEGVVAALDYAIAASPPASPRCGIMIDAGFWSGKAAVPTNTFRYAAIPAEANPETVLERLAALR